MTHFFFYNFQYGSYFIHVRTEYFYNKKVNDMFLYRPYQSRIKPVSYIISSFPT